MVCILQYVEDLSDRQAAEAVRARIDWKYLLGLELTDQGFDFTILTDFRARLLVGGAEQRIFELLVQRLSEGGWIKNEECSAPIPLMSWQRFVGSIESSCLARRYVLPSIRSPNTIPIGCAVGFPRSGLNATAAGLKNGAFLGRKANRTM